MTRYSLNCCRSRHRSGGGSGPRTVTPLLPPVAVGTRLRRTRRSASARPRRRCSRCRIVYRRFVASNSDDVTQPPSSSSLLRRPGIDDFVQVALPFARLGTSSCRSRYWGPASRAMESLMSRCRRGMSRGPRPARPQVSGGPGPVHHQCSGARERSCGAAPHRPRRSGG